MFNDIGDLKHKVAQNIKNASKAETTQVYVTGPIHNNRTGKTHWVVVFGDSGQASFPKAHSSLVTLSLYFPKLR
jgi:hypothetical protein